VQFSLTLCSANDNVLAMGGEITFIKTYYDEYNYEYYDRVADEEVADVERIGGLPDGCDSLPTLPKGISAGTAGYVNDAIVMCGGTIGGSLQRGCYKLTSASGEWETERSLPLPISELASSVIDGKLLLSGGFDDIRKLSTTYIYDEAGVLTPGPAMPFGKERHCQITINSTHIFFVGGAGDEAFLLDWPRQEYVVVDAPPSSPSYPACGLINNPGNGQGDQVHAQAQKY